MTDHDMKQNFDVIEREHRKKCPFCRRRFDDQGKWKTHVERNHGESKSVLERAEELLKAYP